MHFWGEIAMYVIPDIRYRLIFSTFDYMAHKFLPQPCPELRNNEFIAWRDLYGFGGMNRLMLRFAGMDSD
jgi:hypothetical protein